VRWSDYWHIPRHRFLVGLCLELRVANSPPTKDCTAAMGYFMASDHDTRVSVSPQPPQDGRWAIFVPASYKNMTLGEAQLEGGRGGGRIYCTPPASAHRADGGRSQDLESAPSPNRTGREPAAPSHGLNRCSGDQLSRGTAGHPLCLVGAHRRCCSHPCSPNCTI
jgi:hypothetical protein